MIVRSQATPKMQASKVESAQAKRVSSASSYAHHTLLQMQKAYGNRATAQLLQTRMQNTKPIQAKLQVGDEEYDPDIAPLSKWGFTAEEKLLYQYMIDAGTSDFTFADRGEMFTFVRRLAPIFAKDKALFDNGINSEFWAKVIEHEKDGHSLARHGPQMTEQKLKDRLTTGYIGSDFAPAGDEGYATSFESYGDYLVTQAAAQSHINTAYQNTVSLLKPLIDDYEDKIKNFDVTDRKGTFKFLDEAKKKRQALSRAIKDNNLNNPVATASHLLPVAMIASVIGSSTPKVGDGLLMVNFFDRYKFVLSHAQAVGKGQRVQPAEISNPQSTIRNPKYTTGKQSPLWNESQLQSMGAIQNTCTTFNPPNVSFSYTAQLEQWKMPQHFPDNGAVGWRG
ncbi:hypothetical protein CIG75_06780 [Tumebacillus algifaecis]|uniref:Uncharacterized protein n=2 Tax=Tumebacillus algifaecis TaxID=1214604 RepID=A0A223D037_9BACL|nr:hypothetical protein CIG75_06780 [Tumebacillus algifaecis]